MTKITLSNGKTVDKPFNKIWIILAIIVILVVIFWQFITFYPENIKLSELPKLFVYLFTPEQSNTTNHTWADYFGFMLTLGKPIWDTLRMSFAGTIIGSLVALPIALTSANNIFKIKILQTVSKFIMNVTRSIPALVMAVAATALVGAGDVYGVLAGIIALSVFSFGIMSKMLYEVIETVDMNPFEALESTGANKLQAFRYAVIPQILPTFVSYLIYIFEINVRSAVILGYVGAGGIGAVIKDNDLYHYDNVGAAIIVIALLVIVVQFISNYLRGKVQ